ncbi:helix-turn-helix domain-containing protein [Paenibacillus sp. FSL L8-0340]|uniref:helix-turn-helix domain-containing protein n=1 Tax=Paenibacillus sp. FSL L8-0340 TaxID=2954685 RepID=UPI003158ACDB
MTVYYTVKDYCTRGLDQTLRYRRRDEPARPSPITGEVEARIIALACSEPPKGYARWTIRLLTRRVIELNIFGICRTRNHSDDFKKQNLNLTLKNNGAFPPNRAVSSSLGWKTS